jgi:NADH-quinone oxidoreductase subunit M
VGTFGMLRYCFELFPSGAKYFTPLVITLSVIGIIYGAIVAIGQQSMKRLIAYTSVSHFGFIALGVFVMTSQGVSGATFYMVNHGFATGALFLIVGFLIARRGTDRIADYGGVQKVAPLLAGLFLISGLAGLSLPGLSTFVSEFLVVLGTFSRYKLPAIIATAAIILAAIYILWMYQRTMNGPVREEVAGMKDLRPRELLAVVPLAGLLIFAGVYPQPVLDIINPAVKVTMAQVHTTDPKPAHPAPGTTTAANLTSTGLNNAAQKGIAP